MWHNVFFYKNISNSMKSLQMAEHTQRNFGMERSSDPFGPSCYCPFIVCYFSMMSLPGPLYDTEISGKLGLVRVMLPPAIFWKFEYNLKKSGLMRVHPFLRTVFLKRTMFICEWVGGFRPSGCLFGKSEKIHIFPQLCSFEKKLYAKNGRPLRKFNNAANNNYVICSITSHRSQTKRK